MNSYSNMYIFDENHDLTLARSCSFHADPGLRVAFNH